MRRINPIYILVILIIISYISFIQVNNKKIELKANVDRLFLFKEKAKVYKTLSQDWNNKSKIEYEINKISNIHQFRTLNISRINKYKSIELKISTSEEKLLENFLNKILNENIKINKFRLTSNNLFLEVGFR